MKHYLLTFTLLGLFLPSALMAATEGVAKIIILRGTAYTIGSDNSKTEVTKGMWLAEGTVLQTEDKSFAKLLFIDKSQMNLGPSSQMKITEFPENKAGIITLIKGEIRSQVTKNYMDMDKSEKSKLYIKTKTAAMGVRGTEFQVSFNPENLRTALVTISGEVSFAQLHSEALANTIDRSALERTVSSSEAVLVTKGQFSGAGPDLSRATIPVNISPAQFEVIKNNDGTKVEEEGATAPSASSGKTFRSLVPPGMDAKAVANEEGSLEKTVAASAGSAAVARVDAALASDQANATTPPPEGYVNNTTGAIAPTAGGFIDLKTAQYIPPPKGSSFDPVTKTYIPPANFGSFDPKTGSYKNDNFTLTSDGRFVPKDNVVANSVPAPSLSLIPSVKGAKVEGDQTGRVPAAVSTTTKTSVTDTNTQELIKSVQEEVKQDLKEAQDEAVRSATRSKVIFTVQ